MVVTESEHPLTATGIYPAHNDADYSPLRRCVRSPIQPPRTSGYEDQEEEGRRARGLGPLERYRGPGSVSCDPDASGLTIVYLAGKLLP
jgi:hypothetical protein